MNRYIKDKLYKEVWEVLQIKTEIKDKLPNDVIKHIQKSASKSNYEITFNKNDEDILKSISTDAFCLYISLYLQYVANEEEKEQLKKVLIENEIAYKMHK